jgi:hypothetical protein
MIYDKLVILNLKYTKLNNSKMKKFLFCLSFLTLGLVAVNAQCVKDAVSAEPKKACCMAKSTAAASTTTTAVASTNEADIAAEKDASIQKRQCLESGATTYFQKSVCSESGKVSWNEVKYNAESKTFVASTVMSRNLVEIQPTTEKKAEKACAGKEKAGAACCAAKKTEGKVQ